MMNTEDTYTPQDNICDECGKRIGDHELGHLWKCLDKLSKNCKTIRELVHS